MEQNNTSVDAKRVQKITADSFSAHMAAVKFFEGRSIKISTRSDSRTLLIVEATDQDFRALLAENKEVKVGDVPPLKSPAPNNKPP